MAGFSYRTIQQAYEGGYKEKGSKFLAFAYSVDSEISIKKKIEILKKEYYDATHHCFAWVLGVDKMQYRAFDDGEPNHSAGDPILCQIKAKDLTNILIVVVRYFGGTKLGVGGLVNAYRSAAEDVLSKAIIIEKEVADVLLITYSYACTPEVMRMVKVFDLNVIDQKFQEACAITVEVKLRFKESLLAHLDLQQQLGNGIHLK